MRHLVIGLGEVGKALQSVLQCDGAEWEPTVVTKYDVIHICFPYSPDFINWVSKYQALYKPLFTVIHSTVPRGTSKKLGAVHSPIRGKHPYLAESILKFKKYVAGPDAAAIAAEFNKYGMSTKISKNSDNTEVGKLMDLMQYGWSILLEKAIKRYCDEYNLDFDFIYREFNKSYNSGYKRMNMSHFTRPILNDSPGKIGGHCVVQMMAWLDMDLGKQIINENEKL